MLSFNLVGIVHKSTSNQIETTRRAGPTHKWVLKSPIDIALAMPPGPVPKDRTAYLEQPLKPPSRACIWSNEINPERGGRFIEALPRAIY